MAGPEAKEHAVPRPTLDLPAYAWPAELMTARQVADTVLLTPKTVRQHIRAGNLRAVRFGPRGGYRITRADAQAWVADHVVRVQVERGGVDELIRRSRLAGAPRAAAPPRPGR